MALALTPESALVISPALRLGGFALAGVALIFGLRQVGRIRRQLDDLARMARGVEEGDYGRRARESGNDVIARLGTSMNRMALRTERVVSELQARDRSLHFLSNHDALTGLPNRRLFQELLQRELAHARRTDERLAVLLLDLDNFKAYNDNFGTAFGDRLLVAVAERAASHLRQSDSVARFGSDEFAVALPKASRVEDLTTATERLLQRLKKPYEVEDHEVLISASVGVALFPDGGRNGDDLLSQAGEALRQARAQGGNAIRVFDREQPWARAHLQLQQDLRHAIREGTLRVHYQPQVSLEDGRVIGLEALVRWPHDNEGLLSAGAFIPLAEETGLMPALGSWLAEEICRQIATWTEAGLAVCPVSVNISGRQFQAGNLAEVFEYVLAKHRLEPGLLNIEVTEGIAMFDLEQVNAVLLRLRELGVKIHLDDFGTGYSSLSFLLQHPVDVLKLDRSFVAGIPDSAHSAAIVRATIALTESLDLALIAEGVETREQLDFLRRHGCESAQGYLLSRPLSVESVEAVLRRGSVELS